MQLDTFELKVLCPTCGVEYVGVVSAPSTLKISHRDDGEHNFHILSDDGQARLVIAPSVLG